MILQNSCQNVTLFVGFFKLYMDIHLPVTTWEDEFPRYNLGGAHRLGPLGAPIPGNTISGALDPWLGLQLECATWLVSCFWSWVVTIFAYCITSRSAREILCSIDFCLLNPKWDGWYIDEIVCVHFI